MRAGVSLLQEVVEALWELRRGQETTNSLLAKKREGQEVPVLRELLKMVKLLKKQAQQSCVSQGREQDSAET